MSAMPSPAYDPLLTSQLFGAAIEACPDALAIVADGAFLWTNQAFARLLGYASPAQLQDVDLAALLPAGHACASGRATSPAGSRDGCGFPSCQFSARRSDGGSVQLETSCQWFEVTQRPLLMMVARDISHIERRRVPREGAARYRAIFDASAIGIGQSTLNGYLVETNRALQQMLGYSEDELKGMHFSAITHPDDVASDAALFQEVAEGRREHYQMDKRYLRKDGSFRWGRLTISVVRAPSGEPLFTIGMVEDITEQKRIEQQLREAERLETVGRLVGGIAHDFNTLLTAIMLYCDMLLSGLAPDSRVRRHAEEIRAASDRGAALVQQLLSFARQQTPAPQLVRVNDLLQSMENMLRRLIGENIELSLLLDPEVGAVKADPSQLQQVALNLVLNARDAMPDGGRLQILTRPAAPQLPPGAPACAGSWIELQVRDTGSGMDQQTRDLVFEPFFTTKRGRGSGLGLPTVQRIVRAAGGDINVESQLAIGTCVTVRLPASDDVARPHPAAGVLGRTTGGSETILLVEDDDAVRRAVRRVLARQGYTVLAARSGAEAIRLAGRHRGPIHLLLADMIMPGIGGRELVRELCPVRPAMKVLYISGYPDATGESGATEVLLFRKPFSGGALLAKVREVLSSAQAQQDLQEKSTC